jgi:hypothetical protein
MTALFFGANYHNEHHAYPGIPCYRLPRVHQILLEKGVFAAGKMPVERGFFASFKPLFQPYGASARGGDFDAFEMPQPGTPGGPQVPMQQAAVALGSTR